MDNFICGGYIFSSNFDSGNLHKVELVKWNEEIISTNNTVGVEFNLWTKPDCAGTEYENLNRSWFFFCVQGGQPNTTCKFNVVNLNKQAKLYSQGMHPVIRVGVNGKWERIKDNPIYDLVDGDFVLSFFHKPYEKTAKKFYYAFTFPFTYTECQNQLGNFERLHQRSPSELDYIVGRLNSIEQSANTEMKAIDQNVDEKRCAALESMTTGDIESEIYFYRELLIDSVEGRRIDLLTITSFVNIQPEREFRFNDLFPDKSTPRCHTFKAKKIVFVSSRVHPGETPASFVLNGFLKTLLDRKNKFAAVLRKMYVFKIVPFLNPDGVFNGCYRSDTLGQNLNRVYLAPKIDTQPSIYAVRKLIRYYHDNVINEETETVDNSTSVAPSIDSDGINNNAASESSETPVDSIELSNAESPEESKIHVIEPVELVIEDASASSQSSPELTPSSTRSPSTETDVSQTLDTPPSSNETMPSVEKVEKYNKSIVGGTTTVFCDKFVLELKPSVTTIAAPLLPLQKNILNAMGPGPFNENSTKVKKMTLKPSGDGIDLNLLNANRLIYGESTTSPSTSVASSASARKTDRRENCRSNMGSASSKKSVLGAIPLSSRNAVNKVQRRVRQASNANINISAEFLEKHRTTDRKMDAAGDDKSNMFLYIDLHGHASKKGIFMYGNHLPNTAEAVECMLLPRLMSMNCQHFHFDACVFSERNMYHKGKRDGLSKEGSGRVAIYKAIGLIKCYTLEGNYNTGKYVNELPPRGKEISAKKTPAVPPKYTPAIYEEVGRALAPSILDLTDSNPLTRIRNSEFRSLQGLRNALRIDIDRNAASPRSSNAMPKAALKQTKSRYLTNANACCSQLTTDISKENKGRVTTNTKQPTSYGKKEKSSTLLLARKNGKVLCDVIPTSSSSSTSPKFSDLAQTQPIPNKRPKVVLSKKIVASEDKAQDIGAGEPGIDTIKVLSVDDKLKIEVPIVDATNAPVFDPNVPCCSHQMFQQSSATTSSTNATPQIPTKLKKFPRKTAASSNATLSILHTQSSLMHAKKASGALKLRNAFASVSSNTSSSSVSAGGPSVLIGQPPLLRTTRRCSSSLSLSKDGRKLKKKKSLKADATLKRKKSRVF